GRSSAGGRVELRELLDGRLLAPADGAVLATQASPSAAFTLVPCRAPSAGRPREGAPRRMAPAQLAQDRRSGPGPHVEAPPKAGPGGAGPARRRSSVEPVHPASRPPQNPSCSRGDIFT